MNIRQSRSDVRFDPLFMRRIYIRMKQDDRDRLIGALSYLPNHSIDTRFI